AAVAPIGIPDSRRLALSNRGQALPIWVEDGGDGKFDAGDAFEFVGRHLTGNVSFYSRHSRHNIYRLELAGANPQHMEPGPTAQVPGVARAPLRIRHHFENDAVMVRFAQRKGDPDTETWYWQRLSFLSDDPFSSQFGLDGVAPGPAALRVEMRGWSRHRFAPGNTEKQHRVEVRLNDVLVASGDWDGQEIYTLETELSASQLAAGRSRVEVMVPKRLIEGEEDPVVDLSLLNWIELDYSHSGTLTGAQTRLLATGSGERRAELRAPGAASLIAFDGNGHRWISRSVSEGEVVLAPVLSSDDASLVTVRDGGFRSPAGISVDRPSSWRRSDRQADYLMIAHSSLIESTRRLAAYHRSRGLTVEVLDVQDVYDEFNHGIVHPRAIRDFIAFAHGEWRAPAPRWVLLVGDASWDVDRRDLDDDNYADWSYQPREGAREGFLKNASTLYADGPEYRGLIPTGSYKAAQGHAASDNYFVALNEEDHLPVLAIGRLPIVDPADLDAIIDKTIRYIEESGVGPWRRSLLWISNEDAHIKRRTDKLAAAQSALGFSSAKIYPLKSEKSNAKHQERLLDAFAEGQLLVHFHGHGGRYIWRTGATDYKKNRDLFNLDHLDQLQPSARLPIVLSMTCFSAPFDHPLADSIGEKFLRLPDRGAIAVLAASWRNSPAATFSRRLVEELTRPQTVGEAILRAKQEISRRDMIETYNLLGDPAVPTAAPQARLELTVDSDQAARIRLEARLPDLRAPFDGRAIIEWKDAEGTTLATEEMAVSGGQLEAFLTERTEDAEAVSVYMWDAEQGIDGIGAFHWTTTEEDGAQDDSVAGSASR
ncbi:MAG: C25 family cysteine peptidase, partial [Acidobacteria bacterium]|nr:C25 family cysteine peptidase [Acidobacteriota bacterium]